MYIHQSIDVTIAGLYQVQLALSGLLVPPHVVSALALAGVPRHGEVGVADQVHVHLLAARSLVTRHERVEALLAILHGAGRGAVHALALLPHLTSIHSW